MNHQEASEQVKKSIWWCAECNEVVPPEHVTFTELHDERCGGCGCTVKSLPFLAPPVAAPTETEADLRREISRLRAELTGADPVVPTQKAVEAAREIHGAVTDLQNGLCAHITVEDFAAILSRHFPAPATAKDADKWVHETACALLNEPDPNNVDKWQEVDALAAKLAKHYPATATEQEASMVQYRHLILATIKQHSEGSAVKVTNPICLTMAIVRAIDAARQSATQQKEQLK